MSANSNQNDDADEEINRREVAWRVFAAEFDDANYSYAESDEERAPNYVITPTGARVNRMFVAGVLTEVEHVNDDVVRARIVDPTGAFVVYAGQYQPDALAFLEDVATPSFVAITGKARTFQPEDSDVVYTSVRPESISEVDVDTRDAWVVQTARQTLKRVATFDGAIDRIERGEDLTEALEESGVPSGLAAGIPLALDHYGTTKTYLSGIRDLAVDAARVIAEEKDEVDPLTVSPSDGENDVTVDVPEQFAAGVSVEPTAEAAAAESEETGEAGEPAPVAEPTSEAEPAAAEVEADEEGTPAPEPETAAAAESEPAEIESEPEATPEAEAEAETESEAEAETGEPVEEIEPDEGEVGDAGEPEEAEAEATESEETESEIEAETGEPVEEIEPDEVEVGSTAEPEETEAVETDEMYELSEEERREVEENYDVGFSTGSEMPEAGEAEIETPDPAELEDAESEASEAEGAAEAAIDSDAGEVEATAEAVESEGIAEAAEAAETAAEAEEVNLENAVLDVMTDLDEGDGADRQELVDEVVSQFGVNEADVEEAIQSALMGGRCYEAGNDQIKPI